MSTLPTIDIPVKHALISVSNKKGLIPLAQRLNALGIKLLSTGGTARSIREAGIPVTDVSEITQFRECLDGRVKTLHPNIHAGILARTTMEEDVRTLEELGIEPIQLVVVNLYPFKEAISSTDISLADAIEKIDIGGPTMLRAAAKNFTHSSILTNPEQYNKYLNELEENNNTVSYETRLELARAGFNHTAEYDNLIAGYFNTLEESLPPRQLNISLLKAHDLRYGENPHQRAGVYGNINDCIDCFHGKQLSYNNYLDLDAAIQLFRDFDDVPSCAIIKHTIPCGAASAKSLSAAYDKAFSTDTVSPFGGIVIVNKELDLEAAKSIDKIFTEIIIAPDFSTEALKLLTQKANRRLVRLKNVSNDQQDFSFKSIFCGALAQETDKLSANSAELQTVTKRKATPEEMEDLMFAWKIVKNVKSNGIVFVKDQQTLGIGSGQTSRVDSSEIAAFKADKFGLSLKNSVLASDAFFPFSDGIEAAAKAGASAVIQPGGSIRDEEVITMADKYNMAMIFTGMRHFRH
ncbi:MAG: bifunctional phosphoribosylaminoimidazolecarboxamide formyltransferase/IMP cyclohydrolase [Balneolales bacterium]